MDADRGRVRETKPAHGLLVALLLSLLLGTGPATAADVRRAHVETADAGKATPSLRSLKRLSETPDDRDDPFLEPAEPGIVELRPDIWPGNSGFAPADIGRPAPCPASYDARAPPASFVA